MTNDQIKLKGSRGRKELVIIFSLHLSTPYYSHLMKGNGKGMTRGREELLHGVKARRSWSQQGSSQPLGSAHNQQLKGAN